MPYWILAIALALIANVVCLRIVAALRRRHYIGADRPWWQTGWRVATTAIVALASGWAFGSYAERDIEWAIPLYTIPTGLSVLYRGLPGSLWLSQLEIASFWVIWGAGTAISWDTDHRLLLWAILLLWAVSFVIGCLARLRRDKGHDVDEVGR